MSEDIMPDTNPYPEDSRPSTALAIYRPETTPAEMVAIRAQQMELVASMMVVNVHYGRLPGMTKPTLLQPGAQLLDVHHGFSTSFELVDKVEDWTSGFFSYTYRCRLTHRRSGIAAGEGIGSCNSKEKKYRNAKYHGEDEGKPVDPRDNVNTYIKMACKRAHVAATLNATGMADYFTQDEDATIGQRASGPKSGSAPYGVCPIHNKPLKRGDYGLYCPTKVDGPDGKKRWCKGTGANGEKPTPAKTPPPAQAGDGGAETEVFPTRDQIKNLGQLFTAALNFFGLSQKETLDALGHTDKTEIADAGAAWEKLVERYQEQGE
jgi:hypothetical protein